jgi:hypothetical protein
MARGVPGLALALAVLYAGCADPSVEDLRRQSYVWDAEDGLCGRVISVDVGRRVWREHGCEANSSVTLAGTASKAEVQALADGFLLARSFDLAPLPAGTCEVPTSSRRTRRIDLRSRSRSVAARTRARSTTSRA